MSDTSDESKCTGNKFIFGNQSSKGMSPSAQSRTVSYDIIIMIIITIIKTSLSSSREKKNTHVPPPPLPTETLETLGLQKIEINWN